MDNEREQTGRISELELAQELGLSRLAIARLRKSCQEGTDWVRENRAVVWKQVGQERLKKILGAEVAPAPEKGPEQAPGSENGVVSLLITQVPKMNRRILCARKKDGAAEAGEVRVRVRDNQNFIPGMEIRATQDLVYDDVFNLEGRCPRYRGRW